MYAPTTAKPAASPRNASFVRPALYHYAPAPYTPRRAGKCRSMAAAYAAAGYTPCATALHLQRQWARAQAGLPLIWPKPL